MITILDYGVGNLGSIQNMLRRLGIGFSLASNPTELIKTNKLLLPGVGAFDAGMVKLHNTGLGDRVKEMAHAGVPIMGICLGAQLMTQSSDEGTLPGLGLFDAACTKFSFPNSDWKIPHMGWEDVPIIRPHPVLQFSNDLGEVPRFYFAHSYHFYCREDDLVAANTFYGYTFPCILARENLLAVQFHPEKSHRHGLRLFKNFDEWRV